MRRTRAFLACFAVLTASPAAAQPLVVIDPGHGGADPGAVGCMGLEESGVVLDVCARLTTLLEAAGVRVTMTRETDVAVGLSARASLANSMGADVFVSNHSNSNAGTAASGTETFVATSRPPESVRLATLIQTAMIDTWGLPDRGVKFADFVVVRDTSMPAALAELAFTNRCTPDAALLRDPAERQRMAEAQAGAILEWLGVGPGPGMDGVVRGVVFEDQGVGTEDLSVRLPGASVRVVETGATMMAASPDAAWTFTLPAGTYTLEASIPGHTTNMRSCVVTRGGTTWCSIGLFAAMGTDAGTPDAGTDAPLGDAGVTPRDAGSSGSDAGTDVPPGGGCGCRASRGSTRGVGVLAFALFALVLRRRRVMLALALLVGCGGAGPVADPTARAERLVRDERAVVLAAVLVTDIHTVSPVLSPDGAHVLVPSRSLDRLEVVEVATGARRVLAEGPRVGLEPRWAEDGSIAYRSPEDSDTAIPSLAVGLDGQPRSPTLSSHGVHTWVERGEGEDRVLFRDGHTTRTVSRGGDRYLLPSLSAAGWLAYWGAETGVHAIHPASANSVIVGDPMLEAGTFGHPRFDASGRYLALERTFDDGHVITSGEIRIVDLGASPPRTHLLATEGIARQPSLSRLAQTHGGARGRLAYVQDGVLMVLEITLPR